MKLNKLTKSALVLCALIALGGVSYAGSFTGDNNSGCGGNCAGCHGCRPRQTNCAIYKEQLPSKLLVTKGEIVEKTDQGGVTIKGQGNYPLVTINYNDETEVVRGKDGKELKFSKLKVGDKVTAYYSPTMSRSIPPQTNAYAVVVGDDEKDKIGRYVMVKNVVFENNAAVVTDVNGDLVVTINGNAYDDFRDIEEGDELLIWYDMMTMSLPAQANAVKAVEID